jgi:hypothetical protein
MSNDTGAATTILGDFPSFQRTGAPSAQDPKLNLGPCHVPVLATRVPMTQSDVVFVASGKTSAFTRSWQIRKLRMVPANDDPDFGRPSSRELGTAVRVMYNTNVTSATNTLNQQ